MLHVIEDLAHHVDWHGDFEQSHIDKIIEWEKKKAEERLDQICENHLEGCPLYVKHIALGDPAREILRLMEQEKVDMVVMSSRGREGKFGFGSVEEKVVKNSKIPVVTIPINSQSLHRRAPLRPMVPPVVGVAGVGKRPFQAPSSGRCAERTPRLHWSDPFTEEKSV